MIAHYILSWKWWKASKTKCTLLQLLNIKKNAMTSMNQHSPNQNKANMKFKFGSFFGVFSFVQRQRALTRMPVCLCIAKQ